MERYEDKDYEEQVDKSGPRNRNDNRRNSNGGKGHFNKGLLAIRKACKSYSFDSLRVEL
jgi:sulfatase maturation enzyme AslB (radical SAM superfamily)